MRNHSFCTLFATALSAMLFAACSGASPPAQSAPPPGFASSAAPLKGVTVKAFLNQTPLAGIPVEMYTGKSVESCPPFGQPCIKKLKGLAQGTTGRDGQVELTARFSGLEIVCVEAYSAKKFAMVQECDKNFPNTVILQLAP